MGTYLMIFALSMPASADCDLGAKMGAAGDDDDGDGDNVNRTATASADNTGSDGRDKELSNDMT